MKRIFVLLTVFVLLSSFIVSADNTSGDDERHPSPVGTVYHAVKYYDGSTDDFDDFILEDGTTHDFTADSKKKFGSFSICLSDDSVARIGIDYDLVSGSLTEPHITVKPYKDLKVYCLYDVPKKAPLKIIGSGGSPAGDSSEPDLSDMDISPKSCRRMIFFIFCAMAGVIGFLIVSFFFEWMTTKND